MPGFLISNFIGSYKLGNYYDNHCINDEIINENYTVKRNTLNKFLNDKVFFENPQFIIITEGIILNSKSLLLKYKQSSLVNLIIQFLSRDYYEFFNKFRGSFSGAVYFKEKDEWIIYTNQIGDKAVFYYFDRGKFVVGSQFNYILDLLKEEEIKMVIDEKAIYFMLTYGFMGDNSTYATKIKRLKPGTYIRINSKGISLNQYHSFMNNKYELENLTEEEIIDVLDEKFTKAIKLEYEKDLEYGYRHLVDLSGGLDSRMNTWVANVNGYKDIVNISYSQSNYLDEKIAKNIASYLKNEIIIKTLDDASFIYDIEDIVIMNFGLALYSGITGGKRLLDLIDFSEFGVEHTGMLGDVIVGTFLKKENELEKLNISGTYSTRLLDRINNEHLKNYINKEQYMIYVRGFNGALNTHLIRQNYTEVASPFLDVDFLEFCLSIPLKYRINHRLYKNWIVKKYNKASTFKWEKTNSNLRTSNKMIFVKKIIKYGPNFLLRKLGVQNKKQNLGKTMNPFDYWYHNNLNVKKYLDNYFDSNINSINIKDEIRKDLEMLYVNGNTVEKTQVLTVIASIKLYFNTDMERKNEK